MYADTISDSMRSAIDETNRRREIQIKYNEEHGIIPQTIVKEIPKSITMKSVEELAHTNRVADKKLTKEEKIQLINELEEEMRAYAKDLNFEAAAQVRDAILELKASK